MPKNYFANNVIKFIKENRYTRKVSFRSFFSVWNLTNILKIGHFSYERKFASWFPIWDQRNECIFLACYTCLQESKLTTTGISSKNDHIMNKSNLFIISKKKMSSNFFTKAKIWKHNNFKKMIFPTTHTMIENKGLEKTFGITCHSKYVNLFQYMK